MEKIIKKIKFNNTDINLVINLNNRFYDVGFYSESGYENDIDIENNNIGTVTGTTISRLNELKKYTESSLITDKYVLSSNGSNGLILSETTEDLIVYIVDGINYTDNIIDGSTSFSFIIPEIYEDLENNFIIKEDKFLNYNDYKEINDIDVVRQTLNIFESHIRLSDIRNVEELTLYGGGYFNIINNS